MFVSDWSALMTPQKTTLDSMRFRDSYPIDVSHLSFTDSLTAAALCMYLYGLHTYKLSRIKDPDFKSSIFRKIICCIPFPGNQHFSRYYHRKKRWIFLDGPCARTIGSALISPSFGYLNLHVHNQTVGL